MARGSKRGEWNSYLTDADQYKLSKKEILERKKLFISKNNLLIPSSTAILNKQKERVNSVSKKSEIRTKENNGHLRSISQSPFTIASSSAGTTHSVYSDDDHDSIPGTETDESIDCRDDVKDLSSLDLLEQSCDQSYDPNVPQHSFQKQIPAVGKINKESLKTYSTNTKKKKSVKIEIIGKDSIAQLTSGRSKQIPLLELSHTSLKETESIENDGNYLIEMVQEIQTLRTELRYYEQLSGRKSILNGEVCVI